MSKRTYSQRAEYIKLAVKKRREKLRLQALLYKGVKCQLCGYSKCKRALVFHHLEKEQKSFTVGSQGFTRSWVVIKKELDKCILLCANCHMEIHAGITQLPDESQVEKRGELLEAQTCSRG